MRSVLLFELKVVKIGTSKYNVFYVVLIVVFSVLLLDVVLAANPLVINITSPPNNSVFVSNFNISENITGSNLDFVVGEVRNASGVVHKWFNQTFTGRIWNNGTIDSPNVVGEYNSLFAVDENTLFVSYYNSTGGDLKFAKSTDGGNSWSLQTIDSAGDVGQYNSLYAVGVNNIFVSYYKHNATFGDLKFAKSTDGGNSWSLQTVDAAENVGEFTSLFAVDASTIFIGYRNGTGRDLKFAKSVDGGGNWTFVTVDSPGDVGLFISLFAVDTNAIYISYYNQTGTTLKFAKSVDGGANWSTKTVDANNSVGKYTSLYAIGDNIFISYEDDYYQDLKFAESNDAGNTWTTKTIDTDGNIGESTSIHAVDTNNIYISHYDRFKGDLRFVQSTDGGDTWSVQLADARDDSGYASSLHAIDVNTIFITHHYTTGSDLKLVKTTNGAQSWTSEINVTSLANGSYWVVKNATNFTGDTSIKVLDFIVGNNTNGGSGNQSNASGGDGGLGDFSRQPPPKRPDFIVTELTFAPKNPKVNQQVNFRFVIMNNGTANATNVGWSFDTGQVVKFGTIKTLNVGQNVTRNVHHRYTAAGTYNATVFADPGNLIAELREDNNGRSTTINVKKK